MPRKTLASLGALVKTKRGERKLREIAHEIGIGPATLMRIENGRIPDVTTYAKICRWLDIDPGALLGFDRASATPPSSETQQFVAVSLFAHLRADRTPSPETAQALARMILLAAQSQSRAVKDPTDDNV